MGQIVCLKYMFQQFSLPNGSTAKLERHSAVTDANKAGIAEGLKIKWMTSVLIGLHRGKWYNN